MMGDAPKNLALNLRNTKLEGVVSSATQHYREGLRFLEETIREELSNVTQTPAPTVNNGVWVKLENGSAWTPVGKNYLTRLEVSADSAIHGTVTVGGEKVAVEAGKVYAGEIVVTA